MCECVCVCVCMVCVSAVPKQRTKRGQWNLADAQRSRDPPPRPAGLRYPGWSRSWVAGSLLNEMREQPPKQTAQVGVGETVRDGGAWSRHADISCGSLTLLCGLHKFHSELLSMKLMKS